MLVMSDLILQLQLVQSGHFPLFLLAEPYQNHSSFNYKEFL